MPVRVADYLVDYLAQAGGRITAVLAVPSRQR